MQAFLVKLIYTHMKTCAFPDCNKPVTSWRMVCCSLNHQRRYAGLRAHKKVEKVGNRHKVVWANSDKIKEFYNKAKLLTETTEIPHEVDHIVPVFSRQVCGLHNEFNLRIVTQSDNRSKGNGSWQDLIDSKS
jgi:hypothetical protein